MDPAEYQWQLKLQEKTQAEEVVAVYRRLLHDYGIDESRIEGLAVEITNYKKQLGNAISSIPKEEQPTLAHLTIQGMGAVTQPVITAGKWAGSVAKYTKNRYEGSDMILTSILDLRVLKTVLESKSVGSHGMRCLMAAIMFRELVEYANLDRIVGNQKAEDACYDHVSQVMGTAITSRFLYTVISKKTLVEVTEIASNIRKALKAGFQSSSWLTGSARETALRKLANMRQYIGGLGDQQDGAFVEKYYASFPDFSPTGRFFKAFLEAAAATIHQACNDTTMLMNQETTVNAFYLADINTAFIPAPIMLPNFFFAEGPASFNYGSIGMFLGHEIMHGYDVRGSQYDENGELKRWMSPESNEHYVNNTLCLRHSHRNVKQARQEVLNDMLDSEDLADFVGTMLAYSAFSSLPSSKRDTTLPGVAMTANQLFFVGHCAKWCDNGVKGDLRHNVGRSRCIVPLMNMAEFSDAFHCKQDSYMNPPKKCSFWT